MRVPYPDTAFHLDDKPAWIRERLYTWHGIYGPLFEWRKKFPDDRPEAVKDFENMVHGYWGTILSVDDSVGRLFGYLEEHAAARQHDHRLHGRQRLCSKASTAWWTSAPRTSRACAFRCSCAIPGLARGKVVEQQALTLDVAPSLLELCGAKPLADIHGKSWVKLVREGDAAWRNSWFYEYNYEKQFPYTPNVRAVRTDDWKYIHYPHGDGAPDRHMAELYDLKNDPEERHNLITDPKFAGRIPRSKPNSPV